MTIRPATAALTDLTNSDLARFEATLREQRRFRLHQLEELSADGATGEITEALGTAARHALGEIDLALDRLHCGRYGRCVDCGRAIDRDRLEAIPAAARCLACQHRISTGRPPPHRPTATSRGLRAAR